MRNSITLRYCVLILFLVGIPSASLFAQGVTTAAMNGRVLEKNGEALPGANVVAEHLTSGSRYGTSTRADGKFNLPGLRVGGPYTVTVSLVGYQKQVRERIYLQLSQNLDLDFTLIEETVEGQEVLVVGNQSSVFNASRAGAATNVSREQIDRLPTISRSFQDYYKVSPYVAGDKGNALGRNSKYNNIQIDGTNFNDVFGLGSTGAPAGQSTVTPISLDAIEEFQIVVSPYDVRQSGFTGAGINAVTRSGTNEFKGSAFYYGRNENFVGKSPDTLKTKLAGFKDYQAGGRIGGPIIENSLFFFANGEVTRFSQPFTRTFGTQSIGTNAYPANSDSLKLLADALKTKYGYDAGSFSNIGQNRESDKLFFRFDFNLAEEHKLTARWNYLRSSEDNSPSRGRGTADIYFDNAKYKLDNKTHSFALQLTSVFGNSLSNELTLGYVDQFDRPVYYGAPFPTIYLQTRDTSKTFKGPMNIIVGAEEFRHYNELGQKYFEIQNNFTMYLGDHTLTLGAKVDLLKFRNLFIPDAFGQYAYSSIRRFLQDLRPDGNSAFAAYTLRYSATANPLQEANWGATQYGVYAQDEWTVSPALKLTAGVRADIPTYPDHPNYNPRIDSVFKYRTDTPPKAQVAFSPRFGFNWALDEERMTQLRGGIGIFYGKFPYVWVGNQYANTGVDFYTLGAANAPTRFNPDPYNQVKPAANSFPSAQVDITDPNFKAPSVIRWNLAVDHKLPWDIVAGVEGIFSTTQNDVYYQNINLKGIQDNVGVLSGGRASPTPGGRLVGENREVFGRADTNFTRFNVVWVDAARFAPGVYLVRNTSLGSNANVTVQLQRSVSEGINGTLAYTWGMAKDIASGNSTTATSGWRFNPTQGNPNEPALTYSQYDRRHRILGTVSYRHDWGDGFATSLGVFYNGQAGRPFSYMVNGDVNGDSRGDNDLAYIPKDVNDIVLVGSSGAILPKTDAAYSQLMAFIDGDSYLSENKGKISERSGPREPWSHQVDLRLAQEIPTFAGQRIEITFDILNVLNLFNSDWGWVRTSGVNQTVNMLTFSGLVKSYTGGVPNADNGKPRYQWLGLKTTDGKADPFQPDNILSRWQMQFGIRYTL